VSKSTYRTEKSNTFNRELENCDRYGDLSVDLHEYKCYKDSWRKLDAFQCRTLPDGAVGADGSLARGLTLDCVNGFTKTTNHGYIALPLPSIPQK
jgi:N-acetylneuraminic acid mutarotase